MIDKEKDIYDFIDKRGGGVSFVELQNEFPYSKGDREYCIEGEGYTNIVLWVNLSSDFINHLESLLSSHKIVNCVSNFMVYMMDGATLNLPLAKTRRKYKKPHWIPLVFWSDKQAKTRGFFDEWKRKGKK